MGSSPVRCGFTVERSPSSLASGVQFGSQRAEWPVPALFQPLELSSTRPKSSDRRIFSTGGGFLKWWVLPPNHPFVHRVFPLFSPSILGYPYFWKHPGVFGRGKREISLLPGSLTLRPQKKRGWKTNDSPLLLGIVTNLGRAVFYFGGCSCVFGGGLRNFI